MYEGSNMIFKLNLNLTLSLLHPKQIPEPHIPEAHVSVLVVLVNLVSGKPQPQQTKGVLSEPLPIKSKHNSSHVLWSLSQHSTSF